MGHWEFDLCANRITWSPQYSRMLGYEPETLHPSFAVFLQHLHPDDHARIIAEIDTHRDRPGTFDIEFRLTRLDGESFLVRSRGRTHPDAAGRAPTIGINQDITEARRVEAELRAAKEAAEAASQAKSLFLATMSHELRTPLNAIIGDPEMLHEEATDLALDPFIRDLGEDLCAAKHLLSQITDLLDLSRLEAGKMTAEAEPLVVAEIVSEVADLAAPSAENTGTVAAAPGGSRPLAAHDQRRRQAQTVPH